MEGRVGRENVVVVAACRDQNRKAIVRVERVIETLDARVSFADVVFQIGKENERVLSQTVLSLTDCGEEGVKKE